MMKPSGSSTRIHIKSGFTLVELLIVIVVIAILAAITIIAYGNVTNKANDSAVRNDLDNVQKGMEMKKVELGTYPTTASQLPTLKLDLSAYDTVNNNVYLVVDAANNTYAFGVRSKSGNGWILTSTNGVQSVHSVNGATTASAIGDVWSPTPGLSIQGYETDTGWNTSSPWISH